MVSETARGYNNREFLQGVGFHACVEDIRSGDLIVALILSIGAFLKSGHKVFREKDASIPCIDESCGKTGVSDYKKSKAYPGYNLFCSSTEKEAYLMDMNGKIVHKWSSPLGDYHWVREKNQCYRKDEPAKFNLCGWAHVEMDEHGNLFALLHSQMIIKLDWSSRLIWKAEGPYHHEIDLQPDGTLYTLDRVYEQVSHLPHAILVLGEGVVHLSQDGKKINRVSMLEIFGREVPRQLLDEIARRARARATGGHAGVQEARNFSH